MQKVIFISGINSNEKSMFLFKKVLENFELIYFPYNTGLEEKFEELAKQLDKFIKELHLDKNEKVFLIGVSAGGIILDYYLKFIDNKRVSKAVIICSPFGGTYLHLFFSGKRKAVHQVKYGSVFLDKLNSRKIDNVKVISFWSFFDLLIPGFSARYKNSRHTLFFLHWFVHLWIPVLYEIRNFFNSD